MNFCRPSNKTVNKTIVAVNQPLQCYCMETFSIHIIFQTLERCNDRHMAAIKSGRYLGMETCFHSKLKVSLGLIEIAIASTTIKIQMIQDFCSGGISRVVSWQALDNFPHFSGFLLFVFSNTKAQCFAHLPFCLHFTCCGCMML